jgi:dihydroneopterin aldolase
MSVERVQLDRVFLERIRCYGYHGVNPEERVLGQRFEVDVSLSANLRPAGMSDAVGDTISYSEVYRLVKGIVEGPPKNLVESVAEEIAMRLFDSFSLAQDVTVTVRKPDAPVKGSFFDAAGVCIVRTRGSYAR